MEGRVHGSDTINSHWIVQEWESTPYTLDDLADYIDLTPEKAKEKPVEDYGLGRNCMLFDELRAWAYKAIRQGWPDYNQWLNACLDRAIGYNVNFTTPLDISEVKHTAKSVAKWTHRNFTRGTFDDYVAKTHSSEIQAIRGRKGGLVGNGGRPATVTANGNPWDVLGISRATWYRLQNRK